MQGWLRSNETSTSLKLQERAGHLATCRVHCDIRGSRFTPHAVLSTHLTLQRTAAVRLVTEVFEITDPWQELGG